MAGSGSPLSKSNSVRGTPGLGNGHDALKKRAVARVTERIDLAKSRHKPISLVRQEAKRVVEVFLDQEAGTLHRSEREKMTEQVLAEVLGFGPLDELFGNDKVTEFMVLAHDQVISRDRDAWLPLNTKFRDKEQYRATLEKVVAQGEPAAPPPEGAKPGPPAGFDVKLMNGFRAVGVLPPTVLDQPPLAVFTRVVKAPSGLTPTPPPRSGIMAVAQRPQPLEQPKSGLFPQKGGAVPHPVRATPLGMGATVRPQQGKPWTGTIDFNAGQAAANSDAEQTALTLRMTDPFEYYRDHLTQKLIGRLSSAGVYDLSALPMGELSRVVGMYVKEFNDEEKLGLEKADQDRLTLEILVAMKK
jgi:hypothetical protein